MMRKFKIWSPKKLGLHFFCYFKTSYHFCLCRLRLQSVGNSCHVTFIEMQYPCHTARFFTGLHVYVFWSNGWFYHPYHPYFHIFISPNQFKYVVTVWWRFYYTFDFLYDSNTIMIIRGRGICPKHTPLTSIYFCPWYMESISNSN